MPEQTTERLDMKAFVGAYCVSTVSLSMPHSWGAFDESGYLFETYIFPADGEKITDWIESWGTRYRTEDEARAGHDHVVAQVEAGELPPSEAS